MLRGKVGRDLYLESGRVYLRPPRNGDWQAWADLREHSRAFLTPWEPTWPADSLSRLSFRRRLEQYRYEWEQQSGYSLFIFNRGDDDLVGGISLTNVRRGVALTGSLGYWVGGRHARRGFMFEALGAMLDFGFEQLGLHRLEAACLKNNVASQGLLRKSGFIEIGCARQYLRINGQWQDHLLFEILASDRRAAKAARDTNGRQRP